MLEELTLKNFRCYRDYRVKFADFNVIVGRNNAGKSTIIDALKLISLMQRYGPYRDGFILEDRDIPFSTVNLRHNYNDDADSIIKARFSGGRDIDVVFPASGRPQVEYHLDGALIGNRKVVKRHFAQTLGIVPPVGLFEESEQLLDEKYLRSVMVSHLSGRHFRNIWLQFKDGFEEFHDLVKTTWPGYAISLPEFNATENRIDMFYEEDRLTREIFWSGHGFQVWLQLLTHLVKLGRRDTIVLDEPDIYLHSDLQKKLVHVCRERSNQVIIATHAVDIIDEVEPEDVLSVDRSTQSALRLSSVDDLQKCIVQLGSAQNLKMVHLLRDSTCLFVEGEDFRYLRLLSGCLGIDEFAEEPFSRISLGGFDNWESLKHVDWLFKNALGQTIKNYVILDRDYHPREEVEAVEKTLERKGVKGHVWKRKELENYMIHFDALYRMFCVKYQLKHGGSEVPIESDAFSKVVDGIIDGLKDETVAQIIGSNIKRPANSKDDPSTIASRVMKDFRQKWSEIEFRMCVIPGKEFFRRLNRKLMTDYGVTLSVGYVARYMTKQEIDEEVRRVLLDFIALVHKS